MKQELQVLLAKYRALSKATRVAFVVALTVIGVIAVGGPIEMYHLHSVSTEMGGLIDDTNKIHAQQHGGHKFGANIDHSTTTIHGGHSLVVEGDTLGGFMSGTDKTKLDGIEEGAQSVTEAHVRTAMASFSADPSLNSHKLTSLADGTAASDAAAFHQIADAVLSGKANAVDAVSSSNLTLSGTQTVDGVALIAGNRALAYGQTTTTQDGLWVVAAGAWARATDLPSGTGAAERCFVARTGTSNKGVWCATNASGSDVVGTADLTFVNVASGSGATVSSFNTRTGAVVPVAGDYTAAQVGASAGFDIVAATATTLPAYTASGTGVGETLTATGNGALIVDGYTGATGDLILVNHAVSAVNNGVFTLTQGTGGTPYVLTRYTGLDQAAEFLGSKLRVRFGLRGAGTEWFYSNPTQPTLGTSNIFWEPIGNTDPGLCFDIRDNFDWVNVNIATGVVTQGPAGWSVLLSGTGTPTFGPGTSTTNEFGVLTLYSGNQAGSFAEGTKAAATAGAVAIANNDVLRMGVRFRTQVLSDVTNTHVDLAGLTDSTNANQIAFSYGAGSSIVTCKAIAATVATTANGPTVVANQWYQWDAVKYPGDSTLHQYVDGVECGTGFTTGQWPTVIMNPFMAIINSAGTSTTRKMDVDYYRLRICRPQRFAS